MQPDPYYFAALFRKELPAQTRRLRQIVFRQTVEAGRNTGYPGDEAVAAEMLEFLETQTILEPESVALFCTALMPAYGSENYGLFDGKMTRIMWVLRRLDERFPGNSPLRCRLAESMLIAGEPVDAWYPLLHAALMADDNRSCSLSAEVFEALADSAYAFDFDLVLITRHHRPASEAQFEADRAALLEEYSDPGQQAIVRNLRWEGDSA